MDLSAINWENVTLSLAAIAACIILWRDNQALRLALKTETDDHKKTLHDMVNGKVFDLGARVRVVEDKLEIPRDEKFRYMPPLNAREQAALQNLDMTPAHQFSDASSERDKTTK